MTKLKQVVQFDNEVHVFKCYCGEFSYLEITHDKDDKQIWLTITTDPKTLRERLSAVVGILRGRSTEVSNQVLIDSKDLPRLRAALTLAKPAKTRQ